MNKRILFLGASLALITSLANAAPPPGQVVAGYDRTGTKQQTIATDSSGRLLVVGSAAGGSVYGPDATGTPPTQPPVYSGVIDGTNIRGQLGDTSGRTRVVGTAADGAAVAGDPVRQAGKDGSGNTQDIITDTSGNQVVVGPETAGSAVTGGGLRAMGSDGTNARDILTDTTGRIIQNGNVASGAADSGNPVKVGCVYNSTLPTVTTGQRIDCQAGSRGSGHVELWGSDSAFPMRQITTWVAQSGVTTANGLPGLVVYNFPSLYDGGGATSVQASVTGNGGTGVGVVAANQVSCSAAVCAITPAVSAAAEGSKVFKASAGNLYRVNVTTGAVAGYLMVFNATSAPADGAVTPLLCRPVAANSSVEVDHTQIPDRYSTGITAVFSSTGCFTKTVSATAMFEGTYQ